jgi:formylglycine-generating enzyme required for sulfatase activity
MLEITADTYTIGSDEGIETDEAPAHPVPLQAFALGQFPVTNAEYRRFIDANGYNDERWWQTEAAQRWRRGEGTNEGPKNRFRELRDLYQDTQHLEALRSRNPVAADEWVPYIAMTAQDFEAKLEEWYPPGRQDKPAYWNDPAYNQALQPVVGLCWYEANAYCAWLAAQTGKPFRLPTEAEWEAAARRREARAFAWGNTFDAARCNAFESHVRGTAPVGVFPGGDTPEGLIDMTGNVWDWTSSLYHPYRYSAADGRENVDNADDPRGLRGGSWGDFRDGCRCVCRGRLGPGGRDDGVGFRVCVGPPII